MRCARHYLLLVLVSCLATTATAEEGTLVASDWVGQVLIAVDPPDASATGLGPLAVDAGGIAALAYDVESNQLYGANPVEDRLYRINAANGVVTPIGVPGSLGPGDFQAMAFDGTGLLYAVNAAGNTLFTVDPATGVPTFVAFLTGGLPEIEGLAFDPRMGTMYGLSNDRNRIAIIDPSSGRMADLSINLPDSEWRGLTFDSNGGVLYAFHVGSTLYRIDPTTLELTMVGIVSGTSIQGLAYLPNGIPCLGDLDDDGQVGFGDVVALLGAWGACGECAEDLNQDGTVGFADLVLLLSRWSSC